MLLDGLERFYQRGPMLLDPRIIGPFERSLCIALGVAKAAERLLGERDMRPNAGRRCLRPRLAKA